MGTAIKRPVPDRVKPSLILTSGHSKAHGWAPECPDVKNYKWRLNRSGTSGCFIAEHIMATVGVEKVRKYTYSTQYQS